VAKITILSEVLSPDISVQQSHNKTRIIKGV